jgi:hypothetical protein
MNYVRTNSQFAVLVFPVDTVSICGYPPTDVKFPVRVTDDRKRAVDLKLICIHTVLDFR